MLKGSNHSRRRIGNRWIALLGVIVLLSGGLLSGCGADEPEVYQIGIVSSSDDFLVMADGFKAGMAELGYVEGENVEYDLRQFNIDPAGELAAAEEFVQEEVDLIYAFSTESAEAAQIATQGTDLPVVFAYAGIEGATLVKSVREPGGNISGVRFPGPEQISKRLEILLEIAPDVERVWIGYDENYPNTAPALEALRPLAASLGVTLLEAPAATIPDLAADLAARAASGDVGMDAIILMPDGFNHCPEGWELISTFAAEHDVIIAGSFLYTVEQGAVFGNANDLFEVGREAAAIADKTLRGTPIGTIPVVTPDQELWINYKVAQELGLTVPDGLLGMAAEIIR